MKNAQSESFSSPRFPLSNNTSSNVTMEPIICEAKKKRKSICHDLFSWWKASFSLTHRQYESSCEVKKLIPRQCDVFCLYQVRKTFDLHLRGELSDNKNIILRNIYIYTPKSCFSYRLQRIECRFMDGWARVKQH